MSYIDTVPHEHCGTLAGLPLYHPLGEYTDELDFLANPSHLVLGGGGGEHPGAVIEPARAILEIINRVQLTLLSDDDDYSHYTTQILEAYSLTPDVIDGLEATFEALLKPASNFSSWSPTAWYHLINRLKNEHSFDLDRDSPQAWIEAAVGEYVLVSATDLVPPHAGDYEAVRDLGRYLGASPIFGAVMQHPTGYTMFGRAARMGQANMRR